MATNFSSELKKTAKKSLVKSFFGTGVVGRAAMKTFVGKEEEDDPVSQALNEQAQLQQENSATLMRMESVVVNIADNVYNIAGVWAERVASMEEAKRDQKERISKEQAALEEAENEAARQLAPLPSGTSGTDAMNQQETSERGLIGKLADSIKGMGGLLRGVMGKVSLLAAGLGAAGVAVAGGAVMNSVMNDANAQGVVETTTNAPTSSNVPLPSAGGQVGADRALPPPPITSPGGTSGAVSGTPSSPGGMSGAVGGTPSSPGGMSGAVSGTPSTPGGLSGLVDSPDPLANGGLSPSPGTGESAVGGPAGAVAGAPSSAGGLTGAASGGSTGTAGGLSGAVGSQSSSAGGLSGAAGSMTTAPGGLSGTGESTSAPVGGLSMATPSSSGRDISALSSTPVSQINQTNNPVVVQTNNNNVDDQTQDSPLPSPIADRGSLDLDVFFKARYA
jgi:hypothetical protein